MELASLVSFLARFAHGLASSAIGCAVIKNRFTGEAGFFGCGKVARLVSIRLTNAKKYERIIMRILSPANEEKK
jgi:hypothetical protein